VVADSEKSLGDAIGAAVKSGKTTVIAAKIDGSGYVAQFNALREI
jgi:acetolactate synthase-1/2/3 large subunit